MNKIRVFAPSSVSNVACGFDVFGFAIQDLGDTVEASENDQHALIIQSVSGYDNIPDDPLKNVTTIAAQSVLNTLKLNMGISFRIHKAVLPGSGLGSSASAAVAGAMAANALAGSPLSKDKLLVHAGFGEQSASNQLHYDNVAPCMLGGFTIIRNNEPLDVIKLPFPSELVVVIVHPQVEIKTKDAKHMLGRTMPISNAVIQFGNIAGLTAGLLQNDYELIGRSLVDVLAEPIRSPLIPRYDDLKKAALKAGALGCNISGSGPAIFCLCRGKDAADLVIEESRRVYADFPNVKFYSTTINTTGATVHKL